MIRLRHLGSKSFQFLATVVWLVPAVSDAERYEFDGTLRLERWNLAPPMASASVSGIVSLVGNGGGVHLSSLTLASSLFVKPTVMTPPAFSFTNNSGIFSESFAAPSKLGGIMPVPGKAVLCTQTGTTTQTCTTTATWPPCPTTPPHALTNACIGRVFTVGLTSGSGNLGLGLGGTFTSPFGTTSIPSLQVVRVFASAWTEGTATNSLPSGFFQSRKGTAHGPLGGTSSTLNTSSPINRGFLQLVAPLRIDAIYDESRPDAYYLFFGILDLHVVPEPERGIGLITGAGLVAMLGARRARTRRR